MLNCLGKFYVLFYDKQIYSIFQKNEDNQFSNRKTEKNYCFK